MDLYTHSHLKICDTKNMLILYDTQYIQVADTCNHNGYNRAISDVMVYCLYISINSYWQLIFPSRDLIQAIYLPSS